MTNKFIDLRLSPYKFHNSTDGGSAIIVTLSPRSPLVATALCRDNGRQIDPLLSTTCEFATQSDKLLFWESQVTILKTLLKFSAVILEPLSKNTC